jgi:TolB-like protein
MRLASYEVLACLGAGGMGEVYRARDHKLGREVALKVIRAELAADPERRDRFEREARLLAALNHPGIATLYDLEEVDGVRFLVMELVPGQTLAERLAEGPLPVTLALSLGAGMAAGLEAAHQGGVLHRDLKPANIKVTPKGEVKLLDFGLAKSLTAPAGAAPGPDMTREGLLLGTPAYMSPEQARGQAVDRRTDVWAFGCVLYEMLSGRRAFARATLSDTLAAVLEHDPPLTALRPTTPANVRELVRQCLQKDASRRLGDVGVARRLLERAAREPLPVAPPVEPTTVDLLEALPAEPPTEPGRATPTVPVRVHEGPIPVVPRKGRRRPPLPVRPRRSWGRAWLAVVLVVVVGLPVVCCGGGVGPAQRWFANLSLPGRPARGSVAVLPFGTGSVWGDSPEDRAGEAVSAEVTRLLAQSSGLKVTPHSSAREHRGRSASFAARFLDVRWVVAGTVTRQAQQLELRVEVIDAREDRVVQTSTFPLPSGTSKAGQEQTAAEVAALVRQAIGGN